MNSLPRIIFSTIIASIFVLPSIINFNIATMVFPFNFFAQIMPFILIFLMGIVWLIVNKHTSIIKINYLTLSLLLFAIFLSIHFAIIHPEYTAPYLIPIVTLLFAAFSSILISNSQITTQQLLRSAALGILANCYIQIALSILQLLNFHFGSFFMIYATPRYLLRVDWFAMTSYGRITGGIGQANNLADMLTWGLFANLWLINTKDSKILFIFNLILISAFIAITQSRTAYFYAPVMLIYGLILNRSANYKSYALKLILSSIALFILFILYVVFSHYIAKGTINHTSTLVYTGSRDGGINQRLILWLKGIYIFLNNPLLGVGWNEFARYYLITPIPNLITLYRPEQVVFHNCHNLLIQLLATTGVLGTAIFVYLTMKIIRKLVELEASSSIMPLGILLITLTHSMFEFPLFQAYILFPILTLLSIVIKTQYSLPARGFKFILILFLPLTLWQIYSNSNCYLLLTQLKKSPHYIENNYIGNQMDKYFQINRSIFWDDYADMDLSRNIMYDLRVKENQKYFDFLYTTLVRVNNYMPSPASEIKLAILDEISGNTTMAEQRIELVRTAYPNSNKIFEQYIKQLTPNNIVAQAKLIALFK